MPLQAALVGLVVRLAVQTNEFGWLDGVVEPAQDGLGIQGRAIGEAFGGEESLGETLFPKIRRERDIWEEEGQEKAFIEA
ncbi:MAG: hypothetical protein D6722_14165 [Bacteroidetes bacterium]|nr:MAG: hypothetical protein D6722_14165 [Bacteroidota bacterium]